MAAQSTLKTSYVGDFGAGTSITILPTELIIFIFQFACDDIEYWFTALALSVVSREWRSLAHALPELWTHIAVDVRCARPVQVVWRYLHLSRDAPLDVKIDVIGDEEFEQSVALLVRHATRWRSADIRCMSEDLDMFKGLKKAGVPMLESLKLDVADSGWDVKRCKAFRDAPRLWEYAPGGVSPKECVMAWDRLTALATFLKYATSLENLAVHLRNHADLEEVFRRASVILEDRPIESFTFSSGEYLNVWQTFETGGVVQTISSLWRRGVLKSVSMRPLKVVRSDAAIVLKELAQSGLALDVRGVDGRSLLDEW